MLSPGLSSWEQLPAFKGYHGFPACVCISINQEVVHGIPSNKRILKDGDIVGLDFGVSYEGWYRRFG